MKGQQPMIKTITRSSSFIPAFKRSDLDRKKQNKGGNGYSQGLINFLSHFFSQIVMFLRSNQIRGH